MRSAGMRGSGSVTKVFHPVPGSQALLSGLMTIDLRVEVGIVIHFKLAIDLERFPTGPEIETEAAQTSIDIVALLCQHCQMLPTGLAVHNCSILAFCLTAHIVHFQRQNGQAIEKIARRF